MPYNALDSQSQHARVRVRCRNTAAFGGATPSTFELLFSGEAGTSDGSWPLSVPGVSCDGGWYEAPLVFPDPAEPGGTRLIREAVALLAHGQFGSTCPAIYDVYTNPIWIAPVRTVIMVDLIASGDSFQLKLSSELSPTIPIKLIFRTSMKRELLYAQIKQIDPAGGGLIDLTGGEDGAGGLQAIPVPDMGWHGTPEDAPVTKDNRLTFWIHPDRPVRGTLRAARPEDERFVLIVRRTPSAGDVAPCNDARICDAFGNPLGVYVQRFAPYNTCSRRTCSADYRFCESSCSCALAYMCPIGSIYLDCECCLSYSCFPLPCHCTYCAPKEDVFSTYCPGG